MKLRLALLGILAALAIPQAASAACGALPYTFTDNSSVVAASTTNANNSFLLGCATAVDNTQIGPAGIYPSQLVPTTQANGTFGNGASSIPYTFGLNVANQVPLSILGYTAQTSDLLDILSVGRTTKYVWVDSGGVLRTNQAPVFGATPTFPTALGIASGGTGSTTQNFVDLTTAQTVAGSKTLSSPVNFTAGTAGIAGNAYVGGSAAPLGLDFNVPTGSVNGWRFLVNNTGPVASISPNGLGTFVGLTTTAAINASGQYIVNPTITGSTGNGVIGLSDDGAAGVHGWNYWYGSGAQYGIRIWNGAPGASLDAQFVPGGTLNMRSQVTAAATAGGTTAYVPPVYTAAGAALASTTHSSFGTCSMAAASSCTVTLTGAAIFASATSYACSASAQNVAPAGLGTDIVSGSSVAVYVTSPITATFTLICTGY